MLRMFRGISVSQLVAGALASVTALFLSTRIGLAGSLIGAAVSFVVSSTCAQVFNNVLKDSQEQLLNLYGNSGSEAQDAQGGRSAQEGHDGEGRRVVSGEADAELTMVSRLGTVASAAPKPGVDVPLPPKPGMRSAASRSVSAGVASSVAARMPARPVPLPGMDAQLKRKAKRRRVIAVVLSVVTALATVGITAAVVLALTNGQGTDTVVRDVVTPQVGQNQTTTGGTTQNLLPDGKDPATQHGSGSTSDSTGSGSSSGSDGSSSGSTTGGTDSGTGSTGSGSTSDSGSSGSGSSGSDGSSSGSSTGGTDSESSSGSTAGGTGSNSALAQ